jgi:restriction endonuclease S subunit
MIVRATVKSIQDIMRQDVGVDGDAQRISQLTWMFFLKIIDDQDQELELTKDGYRSPLPKKFRWRNWAADPEGITGQALLDFINEDLFPTLKELPLSTKQGDRRRVIRDVFAPEYDLPSSWLWARIGDHLELINGMAFKPTDWLQTGIKIVRIQNLNRLDAPFNYCDPKSVRDRFRIDDGAFLISWSGTPGTSFGAFIWDRGPAVLNQHIFRCDFRLRAFNAKYLRIAVNGRLDEMIAKAHGGVGLQHITKGKLEALLIALPPYAEQHRIVAKVDELMALCDRIEASLTATSATRRRLLDALLAEALAPAEEREREAAE